MKKIVIYPGRFQPMLPHHAEVYKKLQAQFPDADVYVATSDKVDGSKSPFNFKEKVEIMTQLHDIPADKIILAPQPYLVDSFKTNFNTEDTMVIFAVGEKDTDRFPMKNIDPETGLDMKVRGEPGPKYYQMINTLKQHPALPMSERGYIFIAPNVEGDGEVASASAFRKAFTSVATEEEQKEVFNKYFGQYNNNVFMLFKNKILGENMKEQLDMLRKLAGLKISEAPINFDEPEDGEEDFRPGFSQDNMLNQLGKVIDSDDAGKDAEAMKIKNFKPVTSVKTDDGKDMEISPAQAKALKQMWSMLPSQRGGEEQSPREKFQNAIQNSKGLENMLAFATKKGLVKEEQSELPTLDLSDIRGEYDVEEGSGEEHLCQACNGSGCEECDDAGIAKEYQDESSEGGPTPSQMSDEDLADYIGASVEEVRADREAAEEVANDISRDHAEYESIEEAKCGCCSNDPCDCAPDCEGCKSMDEAVEETPDKTLEELRRLAGI